MKKKYTFLNNNSKKIVLAVLISMMWITTLTPMVLAVNTKISVTFDPNGTVTLDVWPNSWAVGVIMAGTNYASAAAAFTVWDNGTISMYVQLQTNSTSDPVGSGMTYTAGAPGSNAFALNTTGFTTTNTYIPVGSWTTYHTLDATAGVDSKTFGLKITIGGTLTTNYTSQKIQIRFQGISI